MRVTKAVYAAEIPWWYGWSSPDACSLNTAKARRNAIFDIPTTSEQAA